jgi:hypothetical protein
VIALVILVGVIDGLPLPQDPTDEGAVMEAILSAQRTVRKPFAWYVGTRALIDALGVREPGDPARNPAQ